nr:hypothetical protein BaRGS_017891 [Batillaria attramentaria]
MSEDALLNVDEEAMILERQRQLDDDDDDDEDENYAGFRGGRKRQRYNVKDAIADLGVDTRSISVKLDAESASRDGWTVASFQRKKQVRRLHLLLRSEKPMTEEEAAQVRDVWSESLGVKDRVRLYLYWLRRYQAQLREEVKPYAFRYVRESTRLAELRFGEDCDILQDAVVIGMTTSGASRYRKVLDSIGCPIVILEEAAEVLEAHVLTTLNQSCQHLILIGDHQQLRPSPTVYELCRHYQLDLSLFERLVNNELPHSTLAVQHRMRPEVARLVRETSQKDGSSKSNQHEAEFCVRLCKYLLQQKYSPETITILAAYSGQVSAFRKIMTQYGNYFHGVRVTTIDNYQGEENDVIILSLKSNALPIGHLGSPERRKEEKKKEKEEEKEKKTKEKRKKKKEKKKKNRRSPQKYSDHKKPRAAFSNPKSVKESWRHTCPYRLHFTAGYERIGNIGQEKWPR